MNHDTANMLSRLRTVLHQHAANQQAFTWESDSAELRRISMTLHRWHELECGDGNDYGSWAIARGRKVRAQGGMVHGERATFEHDDDGKPYLEHHHYLHGHGKDYVTYAIMPDREAGALKRLAKIMARYPALSYYVQTDPRGCALYILRPGDVPAGEKAESYYSRGVAVFK